MKVEEAVEEVVTEVVDCSDDGDVGGTRREVGRESAVGVPPSAD